MARTNCELLCMSKNDFLNIFFIEFKTIGPEIEKNAKVKRAKIKEEYEKAIKICRYQKKQTSLFKKLNTIDENSLIEKALYRRTTLFSQNEDPENGAKSSYSSDDDEFFDEESPNQNVSPLLKMHKVQMDSPKISEVHKKTLLFGKQLELEERMSKFDEKLENLENTLAEFFKSYEENNKLNSSLDWKQEVDQTNLEENLGYAKKKNENEEIIDCYSEGEELENGKKKKNYYRRESNFSN